MEIEGAAYAEPGRLFGVELRRDVTLVEAEQLAVKRARLVAAAGRDRNRDVLQLQQRADFRLRHATSIPGQGRTNPGTVVRRRSSAWACGGAIRMKGRAERRAPS